MKKYDVLKIVVILQAVGMVALASFLIWQLWPTLHFKSAAHSETVQDDEDSLDQLDEVIAVIANQKITQRDLMQQLLELYGDQTLDQMLLHQAITLAASEKSITLTALEKEAAIDDAASGYDSREHYFQIMKEQLGYSEKRVLEGIADHALLVKIAISDVDVSQAEIDYYIQTHAEQFEEKRQYRLSWILSENDSDANSIMSQLLQGADFAAMAAQYSIDTFTASKGGDLGEIAYNDPFYDPGMLEEAANMEVGNITGPVAIAEGYAILKLDGVHVTEANSEQAIVQKAREEVALQKIGSLQEVQDELKNKYAIKIKK